MCKYLVLTTSYLVRLVAGLRPYCIFERYVRTLTYAILAYVNKNRIRAWQSIHTADWDSVRRQIREKSSSNPPPVCYLRRQTVPRHRRPSHHCDLTYPIQIRSWYRRKTTRHGSSLDNASLPMVVAV